MKARTAGLGIGVVAMALGAAGYATIAAKRPQLQLGVGYAARVACGCRFIGNRTLGDCRKDFEPGMEPIRLSEDAAARTVTASVPLIASRTVRYSEALGCQPEPFTGTPLIVKH